MVNFFLTEVLFVKSLFQSVQVFLFDQNVFVESTDFLSRKIEWNEKNWMKNEKFAEIWAENVSVLI